MADNRRSARALFRRAVGVLGALGLVAALGGVAGAEPSTKAQLEAAEAEFKQLTAEIESQQKVLERIMLETAVVAEQLQQAESRYEQITEELRNTRLELAEAQDEFQRLHDQLDARVREAYITGPGNEIEFLLGATSLADLTLRAEYVSALNENDTDLATEVQNVRNTLSAEKADQEDLQAKAADALRKVEEQKAALDAKFAEQQSIIDDLQVKKARAEELVKDLEKKYKRELAALYGVQFYDGVFRVCPVDPPRAVYDGLGAPRYGGGYHPHAGNDIMAPMGTPIRATFDGYASTSTNTLGGYAVYVHGDLGYTYNAHLMQPGVTGPVSAGDIVGYVGTTGNASTPHNHFEWHPNQIPTNWPASPYGYSVVGSAVNPFPLLAQVC
ncbi:MAG TPA: peptidoglycan DD-metalloendopeptidase family protein [Actinomycetota bacterium]|nr:peptidoglycan DD-metalloendopeptidase family protein [Actinomycetota bacterium]